MLPANHYKLLLFSFQRPGFASPSPLRQESKNIEAEPLCQSKKFELFCFFRCPGGSYFDPCFTGKRRLYRLSLRLSRAFFTFFSSPASCRFSDPFRQGERRLYRLNARVSRTFLLFFRNRYCRQRGGNLIELTSIVKGFLQKKYRPRQLPVFRS